MGISCRNNEEPSQSSAKGFSRLSATPASPRADVSAAQPCVQPCSGRTSTLAVLSYFIQGPFSMSSHQHGAKHATLLLWQNQNLLLPLKRTGERNYEIQSLQETLKVVFQRHLLHERCSWAHTCRALRCFQSSNSFLFTFLMLIQWFLWRRPLGKMRLLVYSKATILLVCFY